MESPSLEGFKALGTRAVVALEVGWTPSSPGSQRAFPALATPQLQQHSQSNPRGSTSTSCPPRTLPGDATSIEELRDAPGGSRIPGRQQERWRIPGTTQGLIFHTLPNRQELLFPGSVSAKAALEKALVLPKDGHMCSRAGGTRSFGSCSGSPRSAAGTQREMSTIPAFSRGGEALERLFFPCHVSGFTLLVLALPRKEIK